MTKPKPSKKGFTLIELVVYFTIFGIIGTLGLAVFNYALKARTSIREISEVHINTQRMVEHVMERVRVSQTITDASTTLNLAMASSSLNPTIFSLDTGVMKIKEGTDDAVDLTPSSVYVTDLTFTKITNPAPSTSTVQMSIIVGYARDGVLVADTEYTIQTTVMPLR